MKIEIKELGLIADALKQIANIVAGNEKLYCTVCGAEMPKSKRGSPKKYCSPRCKKTANKRKCRENEKGRLKDKIRGRDLSRIKKMAEEEGYDLTGVVIHHNWYYIDANNRDWFNKIEFMTPEQHYEWHRQHKETVGIS